MSSLVYEISSGYDGFRCVDCGVWFYADDIADGGECNCDNRYTRDGCNQVTLDYYDVLHFAHTKYLMHFDKARDLAQMLGYPYFMWNDRVINSETGGTCDLTVAKTSDRM